VLRHYFKPVGLHGFSSDKRRTSLQHFPNCFLNGQTFWAQAHEEWEHSRETSSWMITGFKHQGRKRSSFDVAGSAPRKLQSDAS